MPTHRVQDGILLSLAEISLAVLDVPAFRFGACSHSALAQEAARAILERMFLL